MGVPISNRNKITAAKHRADMYAALGRKTPDNKIEYIIEAPKHYQDVEKEQVPILDKNEWIVKDKYYAMHVNGKYTISKNQLKGGTFKYILSETNKPNHLSIHESFNDAKEAYRKII